MSDEEYISDEEFLANLQKIDNEKLIQSLQSCGHDGYYNDLYYPIIEEIKRRLSLSPSTEPERKKGEWIWDNKTAFERCRCSECGYYRQLKYPEPENYCPNCGAEMEETK